MFISANCVRADVVLAVKMNSKISFMIVMSIKGCADQECNNFSLLFFNDTEHAFIKNTIFIRRIHGYSWILRKLLI